LGARNCFEDTLIFRGLELFRGDVCSDLHDLDDMTPRIDDRIVRGLNPDVAPAFSYAVILAGVEFPAAEFGPEGSIFRAICVTRRDKHAVMLVLNLREFVAERPAEVFVREKDDAVRVEFDDPQRSADRVEVGLGVGSRG